MLSIGMTNVLQFRFNTYREKKISDLNVEGRTAFLRISKKSIREGG